MRYLRVSQPGLCVSQPGLCVSQPGLCVSQPGLCVSQPGSEACVRACASQFPCDETDNFCSAAEAINLREVMDSTAPGTSMEGFTAKAKVAAEFVRDYSALGSTVCGKLARPSGALA